MSDKKDPLKALAEKANVPLSTTDFQRIADLVNKPVTKADLAEIHETIGNFIPVVLTLIDMLPPRKLEEFPRALRRKVAQLQKQKLSSDQAIDENQ